MRAVAVLTVFANHLFGWPSGGFVGVDIFFVLSGFFITGLLIRERKATHKLSFQNFYTRRVKRIIPSALLVLVVTVAAGYLLFTATRAKDTLLDALYAAVFASNFRFEAVGADYFQSARPPSPIQHYWSLSIEEQFYFVWPLLLVVVFAVTRPLRQRHMRRAREWGMLAVMGLIVAASFGWAMYLSATDPNAAYFSTFARIWELGMGALVAIAGPWLERIPSPTRPALAYAGLAGVVASLFLINPAVQFPAPWAALPVLSTAVVVAAFHGAPVPRVMAPLTNRVVQYFGDTSYTLYLWHWPVIVLLVALLPKGVTFYTIAVVVSLALTAVTYRFYENPIRKSRWLLKTRRSGRRKALDPSAWGLVGFAAASAVVVTIATIQLDHPAPNVASNTPQAVLTPKADPCFGSAAMITPGCPLRNTEYALSPSIDDFAKDIPGELGCYRNKTDPVEVKTCSFGYVGPDATQIALVGDSHARALLPALWPLLDKNKWHLTTYLGVDCVLADQPDGCDWLIPNIQAQLVAHRYNMVITTNLNRESSVTAGDYERAWAPIMAAGSRIVVVLDNPAASEESLACLTRVTFDADHTGDCGTPRAQAIPGADALASAAKATPGVTLVDFTKFYCNVDRCPSVIGNVIVYSDASDSLKNSHPTATFMQTLAQPLETAMKDVLATR
ncbi:acyltransferase family protein [Mycolicibacterium aichiense]|nr:acyltransferase family protein [Mycolicibacterium aichiense]